MMLEWLGERRSDNDARQAAEKIESAVARVLAEGRALPQDLGGKATCSEVGEAVAQAIRN